MPRQTVLSKDDEALIAMAADRLAEYVDLAIRERLAHIWDDEDERYDLGTMNLIRDLRKLVER